MSVDSFGRPPTDFDFHRQYSRKPLRCHRITVSGLTIVSAVSAFEAMLYSSANISRSKLLSAARFGDPRRRLSRWRSSKISACSEARDRKSSANAHQISLQNPTISRKIHPIRCLW
jgi:hypothetical protein